MGTQLIDSSQRLTLDEDVRQLEVWLLHGTLHVVGTDGPARIEVRRVGRKGLTLTRTDGDLSVRHDAPKPRWFSPWWAVSRRHWTADVIIAVPPTVTASLTVMDGRVVASGLREGTRLDVTNGSIAAMGLGGQVRARTVAGSIEAVGVSGNVSLETVSGEISLASSFADRVRARTVSGALTCDLDNPFAQDVHLETVSGSITIRVPEDADLAVDLSATSGSITSAFSQVPARSSLGLGSAAGRLGAGSGRLRAHAISGSVALLASPAGERGEPEPADPAAEGGLAA